LKVKLIFINAIFLLLLFSCTKESINIPKTNLPMPTSLKEIASIELDTLSFTPEKLVSDIKGNIFITGRSNRLILIKAKGDIEEINIRDIYPAEIVDISTDGFDIFLLDRMNRKIWTLKRESILEKGYMLEERPLIFSVSERGFFTVIYSNRREFFCQSRTEKRITGFLLEEEVKEGEDCTILFHKNSIYFANKKNNRIDFFQLYNPEKMSFREIKSPSSLTIDTYENLFIVTSEGIVFVKNDGMMSYLLLRKIERAEISINRDRLYLLTPDKKRIDVFKIIYTASDSSIPGRE